MDLISIIVGIAIGAAFSPFWMAVWKRIKGMMTKTVVSETTNTDSTPKQ